MLSAVLPSFLPVLSSALKPLLLRAVCPLQLAGVMALPEQRLLFLGTSREVHSGLCLAFLDFSEVKELFPKDVSPLWSSRERSLR